MTTTTTAIVAASTEEGKAPNGAWNEVKTAQKTTNVLSLQ